MVLSDMAKQLQPTSLIVVVSLVIVVAIWIGVKGTTS